MMKVPLHIAQKLKLLVDGQQLPANTARNAVIEALIEEHIIERTGRIKKTLFLRDKKALQAFLYSRAGITDLQLYIQTLQQEDVLRQQLTAASTDSKLKRVRSFKGFLVNCFSPVAATLNGQPINVHPVEGSFHFIYDFETFLVPPHIVIVGIENPENFRHIARQQQLFAGIHPLFVSRYPQQQSKDLMRWLQSIPNHYLHFGDFDMAGIGIYLNEFKKHLEDRASFFVPEDIANQLERYGSRTRYDEQKTNFDPTTITEPTLITLIQLLHQYKKGLDQEVFIG